MTKKKLWGFVTVGVFVISAVVIYWFYFSKPAPFPTNEQLLEEMSIFSSAVAGSVIQDTVSLDQEHVYVPFILEDNNYGLSFWEWEHHKWKAVYVSTNGDLRAWKLNSKDPSTYHLIWNFPAIDQPDYMKLYLIKKRGYQISGDIHHYGPGIQMEEKLTFPDNSYGSMQIPTEWVSVINSLNQFSVNQFGLFSNFFNYRQDVYFGWNAYDKSGRITYPGHSTNRSSSSYGSVDIEYVMFVNESDLEYP